MNYRGPIVDVDIHHTWKDDADLIEYLPKEWKEYARGEPFSRQTRVAPGHANWIAGAFASNRSTRIEALPPDGSRPGSDYALLQRMLLNQYPYYRAMLTHQIGEYGAHLNHYYARAVCTAANDWNLDHWADLDERLYTVVVTPSAEPEMAAAEVRRIGGHPKVAAVLLCANALGRPYGDPVYHPIYEAAVGMGLPVQIHISVGADRPNNQASLVGGPQSTGIENGSLVHQAALHFISSFIVHGVFEKFPSLKVLIVEYGMAWLPNLIWRLDQHYDLLKLESPWVKRWPSEYIHDHVKVSTQPIEEGRDADELAHFLSAIDGIDDLLCFSTDFPHVASDEPSYVARLLPSAWHNKVFCTNACDLYGWPRPALGARQAATATAGARA
jgi:uncharacterized protein